MYETHWQLELLQTKHFHQTDGRTEICGGWFQVAEAAGPGKISAELLKTTQHVRLLFTSLTKTVTKGR